MKIKDNFLPDKDKFKIVDTCFAITFSLFLICFGVLVAIYCKPLYYMHILHINKAPLDFMPFEDIKVEYSALIQYCSLFFNGDLVFPTLPASASGLFHFAQVKTVFTVIHIIAIITLAVSILIIVVKAKSGRYRHFYVASVVSLALPLFIGILCAVSFNFVFTLMHEVIFRNDDWLFDEATDPIIYLLPDTFFLQCAVVIFVTLIIGSLVSMIIGMKHKHKDDKSDLLPHDNDNYIY